MTEAPAYNSFPLIAGQDIDLNFTIVDSAGTAVDLTGANVRFYLVTPNDRSAVLDSAASPATATITVTDADAGTVTVSLADTDTDALLGDYYWEMKVTDSDGAEGVTNRGIITFERTIT